MSLCHNFPTIYIPEEDIIMVMEQAGVLRERAVWALQLHDGDIVNAIMELI